MLKHIHIEITREALSGRFSQRALEIILAANVGQDDIRNQIGHSEIHYDDNKLEDSHRYIKEQRGYILANLMTPGVAPAWVAFGKLTHTAQDFYAHTNYIPLWLSRCGEATPPRAADIDPVDKSLVDSPNLHSGKLYYPLEALYFIPAFRKLVLSLLPHDSHAHMNLDSEERGLLFAYARAAAVKRTIYEFELLENLLPPEMLMRFVDL